MPVASGFRLSFLGLIGLLGGCGRVPEEWLNEVEIADEVVPVIGSAESPSLVPVEIPVATESLAFPEVQEEDPVAISLSDFTAELRFADPQQVAIPWIETQGRYFAGDGDLSLREIMRQGKTPHFRFMRPLQYSMSKWRELYIVFPDRLGGQEVRQLSYSYFQTNVLGQVVPFAERRLASKLSSDLELKDGLLGHWYLPVRSILANAEREWIGRQTVTLNLEFLFDGKRFPEALEVKFSIDTIQMRP